MNKINITLEDGNLKEVDGIFYLYNSNYYFIYTEGEIDENGYVVLHLVQVGKEIINTEAGKVDTGNMVGVEIADPSEWKTVQASITKIVNDKKNNTQDPEIQYLDLGMLNNLKIMNKKTFRLMKNVVDSWFGNIQNNNQTQENNNPNGFLVSEESPGYYSNASDGDVVIDYRTSFFEEQQKNEQLQTEINELNEKIAKIKEIIE